MYWPVSTPRIYATSSSTPDSSSASSSSPPQSPNIDVHLSHDGLTPPPPPGSSQDALALPPTPITPATPMTPGLRPVEHDYITEGGRPEGTHGSSTPRIPLHEPILALRVARAGHIFAVITATSMTIWQTKPTVVLAVVVRSKPSLESYGTNVNLLLRPDSAILVVHTSLGYLITYTLATDAESQVYKPQFVSHTNVQRRRQSHVGGPGHDAPDQILWGAGEGGGVRDVSVRFRMVIKVDAGIASALALDDELVVATRRPAAVQCIRWTPDPASGSQTSTELLSRMAGWLETTVTTTTTTTTPGSDNNTNNGKKVTITEMTHDRPMNLSTWITSDGRAYAVQRVSASATVSEEPSDPKKLYKGHCFHVPSTPGEHAVRSVVNARFSLVAVGCADGAVRVYSARDYAGNIPPSHTHRLQSVSPRTSGRLSALAYSPDGYCLFAGYERGWATWSVYGKALTASFGAAGSDGAADDTEAWLSGGVLDAAWIGGGSELLLAGRAHTAVWALETARSAVAGCYAAASLFGTLLHSGSGQVLLYRGSEAPDLAAIAPEGGGGGGAALWHATRVPAAYLLRQWPVRCAVASGDGRYVAVAGRRGLAHYSVGSGRWRTFAPGEAGEAEFVVRGGMCWYQNVLVAAVEAGRRYEIRLYAREGALELGSALHVRAVPAPVVLVALSGEDSLLAYTYDNLLYHFVFSPGGGPGGGGVALVQVGQIAFHGIVRSPARVRGLSWVLPDGQSADGDPSQDVAVASVLFLVDGKLVLLRPSVNAEGQLKYDMRVVAQNVEYYVCMRDRPRLTRRGGDGVGRREDEEVEDGLRNSLWIFDGGELKVWTDLDAVLRAVSGENHARELPRTVSIPVDFYPLSTQLGKATVLGVEAELVQRRDINFSFFRFSIRTHLFLPEILRHYLADNKALEALRLAQAYRHLEYFAHALEILLHQVLDEEVDAEPAPSPSEAVLPRVLSLLSSFRQYLDIVVQCTRKTEVRSWRTLFAYLPPPQELFEESLQRGSLKTAGGYLLILHTFDEMAAASEQSVRLLGRAMREGDWELCKELARFLAALDETGDTLREALEMVGVSGVGSRGGSPSAVGLGIQMSNGLLEVPSGRSGGSGSGSVNGSAASSTLGPGSAKSPGSDSDVDSASVSASDAGSVSSAARSES